jgi:hypothetical protein
MVTAQTTALIEAKTNLAAATWDAGRKASLSVCRFALGSSTSFAGPPPGLAWIVHFDDGGAGAATAISTNLSFVIAVRGGS